jgi:hypothetical protein
MAFPPKKKAVPAKIPVKAAPAAGGSKALKATPVQTSKTPLNARSGQPPVEQPPVPVPSDKPASPGAEPTLSPEADAARKGGIMARIAPAPPGVLPEQPDGRTSYQVKPGTDDSSALIKIGPAKSSPKPESSGIDTGLKQTPTTSTAGKEPAANGSATDAQASQPKEKK